MSFRSVAAKNVVLRMVGVMTVTGAALVLAGAALIFVSLTNESFIRAQSPPRAVPAAPPNFRLPDESTGIDGMARTLISAFDQVDIVALGETHVWRLDTDLRIAVVRHPDFAKKVRSIVVEFGSTTEQSTLDRYIRGENVSRAQLEQVWKTTTQAANEIWDDPIYAEFFAAVRDVNSKLPADARIRVFGGDPGPLHSRRECIHGPAREGLEDHNSGGQRRLGLTGLRGVFRSCPRRQFKAACRCARSRLRR